MAGDGRVVRRCRFVASVLALLTSGETMAAPPASPGPPAPRVSVTDGLAISRSARADRRLGRFTARGDGGYDYRDPKGRFRASIAEDGSVTFKQGVPVESEVCTGLNVCMPTGGLGGYLLDPSRWIQRPNANRLGAALHGTVGDPSTAHMSLAPRPDAGMSTFISIGIGARVGRSRLSNRVKAEFLKDTQELRLRMAVKAERHRLIQALARLSHQLESVWQDTNTPPARRRELLFELWDESLGAFEFEVDNEASSTGEDDITESLVSLRSRAAVEARGQILRFIRRRMPAGSDDAYTPSELRRLNKRRRSREPFAPYSPEVLWPRAGPQP